MSKKAQVVDVDFEPLWDYILFEKIESNVTPGGIHLPDGTKLAKLGLGRVLKAGPGALRDNGTLILNPIKEGDIIYMMAYKPPFDVTIDGKHYYCISGRDVVAIAPKYAAAENN